MLIMANTELSVNKPTVKKTLMSSRTRSKFVDFLFVLPALALLAVFTYYPVAKLVQISLTDWNLLNPTWEFVGLKNWKWLFAMIGGFVPRYYAMTASAERLMEAED